MKTLFTSMAITSLLLMVNPAMAGAGHSHGPSGHGHEHAVKEISSEEATTKATAEVARLVEAKKIDASWSTIKADSVEKKTFNERLEWVIKFNNEAVTDETKRQLYVFLSLSGDYMGANHTGN